AMSTAARARPLPKLGPHSARHRERCRSGSLPRSCGAYWSWIIACKPPIGAVSPQPTRPSSVVSLTSSTSRVVYMPAEQPAARFTGCSRWNVSTLVIFMDGSLCLPPPCGGGPGWGVAAPHPHPTLPLDGGGLAGLHLHR